MANNFRVNFYAGIIIILRLQTSSSVLFGVVCVQPPCARAFPFMDVGPAKPGKHGRVIANGDDVTIAAVVKRYG